jgi:hypothetical protein
VEDEVPKFVLEKLPPHWLFVPSNRQVRGLLAGLGADVRLVEFYGTEYRGHTDRVAIGFVHSRVVEGRWCFYLHLWGVRESGAGPVRNKLAAAALSEIERYLRECESQQPASTVKPEQLYLSFRLEANEVRPECRVSPVGPTTSFPTREWWV